MEYGNYTPLVCSIRTMSYKTIDQNLLLDIYYTIIPRFMQGIAASAVVICSVSILMSIYPERIYQIISVTDAVFGVGYTLGMHY